MNQEFSRTRTRAHPAIYTFCFHNLHHFPLNIIYYSNIQHIYNIYFENYSETMEREVKI